MNKFDSTLLPQTNNTEEIQKGNLDLLAKINATILFMQEGIVTFAQEILKVLSTYIWPASRVSFTPGSSGLVATDAQALGLELANPINTKATIVDADTVTGNDTADGGKVKKWTWATVKAFLKTYFDTLYGVFTSSGVYTPTLLSYNSNHYSITIYQCQWMRVGNVVTVSGRFDERIATTLNDIMIELSLPIQSTTANENIGGSATAPVTQSSMAAIGGGANGGVRFYATGIIPTTEIQYSFNFTYLVV